MRIVICIASCESRKGGSAQFSRRKWTGGFSTWAINWLAPCEEINFIGDPGSHQSVSHSLVGMKK